MISGKNAVMKGKLEIKRITNCLKVKIIIFKLENKQVNCADLFWLVYGKKA